MSSSLGKSVSNLFNDAFKYTSEELKMIKTKTYETKKVSILMITWIHLTGSVKGNYQIMTTFIAY